MPEGTQYKIIQTNTIAEMETETRQHIACGWQPAGPVTFISQGESQFFHEMIKIPARDQARIDEEREKMNEAMAAAFAEKVDAIDKKIKDLLDINGIELFCLNSQLYTRIGDKVHGGISPNEVLNALKASKHCPLDLDEEAVLKAVESLI